MKKPKKQLMQKPKKQPMQPVFFIEGVWRFQPNAIVNFLLQWSSRHGMSLNELALIPFEDEDRRQLAQLIGYSVSGYQDLSYVDDEAYGKADEAVASLQREMADKAETP